MPSYPTETRSTPPVEPLQGTSVNDLVRRAENVHVVPPKPTGQWQNLFLAAVVLGGGVLLWGLAKLGNDAPPPPDVIPPAVNPLDASAPSNGEGLSAPVSKLTQKQIPFDGESAYGYLKDICAIGTRISDSDGIAKHRKQLKDHFEKLGAKVTLQEFPARHPVTGLKSTLSNIVVTWHPERKERILFCAHYDTRPFPDQDPRHPRGTFLGANDGASGIALLMQLGKMLPKYEREVGVDFVFFDGEEWVYDKDTSLDFYFLGSKYFAQEYIAKPPGHRYRAGILLDMVGGKNLDLPVDATSWGWEDSRPLIESIWLTARKLEVTEFQSQLSGMQVSDDHVPLHNIAKIPMVDIIHRFPWQLWHTTHDTPENCSPLSLAKVGWVLQEWLNAQK